MVQYDVDYSGGSGSSSSVNDGGLGRYTLRIPKALMEKIQRRAKINKRSVNKEIEAIIEENILPGNGFDLDSWSSI
jgi:hypothetical protein